MGIKDLVPGIGRKNVPVHQTDESPFQRLQDEMNQLFDDFFKGFGLSRLDQRMTDRGVFLPHVNVREHGAEIVVTAELPGLEPDDIDISVSADAVTLKGEKREESKEGRRNYYRLERSYGSFHRVIPLPGRVKPDEVEATFKNGVLRLQLPREKTETENVKKIKIKTS